MLNGVLIIIIKFKKEFKVYFIFIILEYFLELFNYIIIRLNIFYLLKDNKPALIEFRFIFFFKIKYIALIIVFIYKLFFTPDFFNCNYISGDLEFRVFTRHISGY